jgi:adenine-specific DNA-methyltransferase
MEHKHNFGQYFTTNLELKKKLYEFIHNEPENILEPSIGQGDLVHYVGLKIPDINFDMYEIDENIKLLDNINRTDVVYGDFLKQKIDKKYKTIIGNPPYVKTNKGNLYIQFIGKCLDLLEENGEMIFIIPSDFLKLTSSSKLLKTMMEMGTFTDIYHPHKENLFENASIDIIIFRYCKNNTLKKKVRYNNKEMFISNNNGMIIFEEEENKNNVIFSDIFDIYVGMVSGKESVYKSKKLGNIKVINGENKIEDYIFIEKYPCGDKHLNDYLEEHRDELIKRKMKKFNDKNWFEWGAPRNIKKIIKNKDKKCIYLSNMTRKNKVSFIGKVSYFGGSLLSLIPKKDCDLDKINDYLNSKKFKSHFMYSGRFKIGHRQISNMTIPNIYLCYK